jgi:polyisoprenoid-binding protein YceI
VTVHPRDAAGNIPLSVTGQLTLHGSTRQRVLQVTVAEKDDTLEITGEHEIKQTDFGMEPYSSGLGSVGVKDEVMLTFKIVAKRAP